MSNQRPGTVFHPTYRARAFFWLYGRAVLRAGQLMRSGAPPLSAGATDTPEGDLWVMTTGAGYGREAALLAARWAAGLTKDARLLRYGAGGQS